MKRIIVLLLALCPLFAIAQHSVTCTVKDINTGEVLPGATVILKNTNRATATDANGVFTFSNLPIAHYTVKVSFIGYQTMSLDFTADKNETFDLLLTPAELMTDEVIVRATKADDNTPTTYKNLSKEDIEPTNLGQDLPYLLDQTPSMTINSDAGAGVGYTSFRIRGTDATGINMALNGIPYNDAESHGIFLVNLPDFASSIENIQIQRGVGASTNGASAFGATVNVETNKLNTKPNGEFNNTIGSFGTIKNTLKFGTGLIKDRFVIDGRLSNIQSDGYIDRASSDLKSYYLSAGYYDDNTIIRLNYFVGKERTYQAWNGVFEADLEDNRTSNSAGTESDPPYENEVDNYKQDHYQLLFSQNINTYWDVNLGLHYTKGKGYFEQYKAGESFGDYSLNNVTIGDSTITETDLIRRRWLDNDFYGATYAVNYDSYEKFSATIGGAWNQYNGDHFGEIVWAQYASNGALNHKYYDNNGLKTDFNTFIKMNYKATKKLNLYADLQYRNVAYTVDGVDNDQRTLFEDVDFNFFNPKAGLSYSFTKKDKVYASFAIAHREPNRNDFIDAVDNQDPKAERMYNVELGYKHKQQNVFANFNYYMMYYKDQLVLTGAVNDVGSPIRTNVDESFRTGIEIDAGYNHNEKFEIKGNFTFSVNQISEYEQTLYTFDDNYTPVNHLQLTTKHENTDIAFSPNVVGGLTLGYIPVKGLKLNLINKYVGKQFLDNTSSADKMLDDYLTNNILISYTLEPKILKSVTFSLLLNNITNRLYESSGYTFSERYIDGSGVVSAPVIYNYYYPQAGFNVLAGLSLKF